MVRFITPTGQGEHMAKPAVFVGCSKERIEVGEALHVALDDFAEVTVWPQQRARSSSTILGKLLEQLDRTQFAVFVFWPDDSVSVRGERFACVRDNVTFEAGLFIGRLGTDRVMIITPKGYTDLRVPTDLAGVETKYFDETRHDGNLSAALVPIAKQVKQECRGLDTIEAVSALSFRALRDPQNGGLIDADTMKFVSRLETWLGIRDPTLNMERIELAAVDRELGIPAGTAERYLELAARRWEYVTAEKQAGWIRFTTRR